MKHKISIVTALLLLLLTTMTVAAQSGGTVDLTWSSIDGGGGVSSGNGFTLISTIGQGEAGTLQGGPYTLSGGFLAGSSLPLMTNYRVHLPVIVR